MHSFTLWLSLRVFLYTVLKYELIVAFLNLCAGMWYHMLCTPTRSKQSPSGVRVRVSHPHLYSMNLGHLIVGMGTSKGNKLPYIYVCIYTVYSNLCMFSKHLFLALLVPKERNVMI